jgi:gamma-glutamyl:cysteine ligase YbdK (ATP-grasp superfamily)
MSAELKTRLDRPAFSAGPAFAVGAEEELLLVDGTTGAWLQPALGTVEVRIFSAFRDGRSARLYFEGELRPSPEIVSEAVRRVGPLARDLDCEAELGETRRIAYSGNGPDCQRRRFAQDGMAGLPRWLIEETAVSGFPAASVAA